MVGALRTPLRPSVLFLTLLRSCPVRPLGRPLCRRRISPVSRVQRKRKQKLEGSESEENDDERVKEEGEGEEEGKKPEMRVDGWHYQASNRA